MIEINMFVLLSLLDDEGFSEFVKLSGFVEDNDKLDLESSLISSWSELFGVD